MVRPYVDYTNSCLYRIVPPDNEQQACSKHVDSYYCNKLIENSVSCWFVLYGYIMMHGQQIIKKNINLFVVFVVSKIWYFHENEWRLWA